MDTASSVFGSVGLNCFYLFKNPFSKESVLLCCNSSCFPDYDEETYYEQLAQLLETNSQTKIIGEV